MYRELSTYEIRRRRIRRIRAVLLVAVAIALLVWAIGAFQHAAREQSAASIRSTVLASAAQCYAIEGSYPASISHLEDVYGLAINRNDYTVNYEWFADNVPPHGNGGGTMRQNNMDIVSAMATIRNDKHAGRQRNLFVGILMLVILGILLIALVTGVTVYQRVASVQMQANEDRLGMQFLANNVRSIDGTSAVWVGTGPEGNSLVLMEYLPNGNYETRMYLYKGNIVQEYAVAGTPYDPGKAVKLSKSSKFDLAYRNGLLTIVTDQGRTDIALRAMQGGS